MMATALQMAPSQCVSKVLTSQSALQVECKNRDVHFARGLVLGGGQARPQIGARRDYGATRINKKVSCGMIEVQELINSRVVKAWPPKEAGKLVVENPSGATWRLLDVRPSWERERSFIDGSVHVPLFIEDDGTDVLTLLRKQIQFGFGGWWLGQRLTKRNEDFVQQVRGLVPSLETPILVACGEGLRSLLAIDELYEEGYSNLAWLAGGLNNAREGDFAGVEGETLLQFATAGGVQGILLKIGQQVASIRQPSTPPS
eukprot:TRINITY_DN355_c0_g1_i1.p1 TRINITY_DN355_c0_g1~~TRINITY_DN355_c0_g1_i1.p1  ORF type:complete len:258 (+),score=36.63 TRINITY_DN355_c0_g1_i1:254-1027(+)